MISRLTVQPASSFAISPLYKPVHIINRLLLYSQESVYLLDRFSGIRIKTHLRLILRRHGFRRYELYRFFIFVL